MLDLQQRTLLLTIARESIASVFRGASPEPDPPRDQALLRPSGAFVTLTIDGVLRGCIGSIEAVHPLWRAVMQGALNAAFRDPRFPALRPAELARVDIEISVMSPIVPVGSLEDIVVGRDGLIVHGGDRAGLLLPQVATEYGWDRDTFLTQTCLKAGLSPNAWRPPGCRIERFSAEVFGELSLAGEAHAAPRPTV